MENLKGRYELVITGEIAKGRLPDGTIFTIDADIVDYFCQFAWNVDKDGYIRRSEKGKSPIMLHRWIAEENDPTMIVDHINRNRADCRRSNLRIVTASENAMNHGKFCTNQTGFIGVYYSNSSLRYEAKIGFKGKRIFLGSSRSKKGIVKLAQMYNIAASFLFGMYSGLLNAVPPPDEVLVRAVVAKCEKYKGDANGAIIDYAACPCI